MPWPYTIYVSLRSPVESFISICSHHLQQTTQASRKLSRYDLQYLQLLVLHLCDSSESGKCNWVDPQVPNGLLPNRKNVSIKRINQRFFHHLSPINQSLIPGCRLVRFTSWISQSYRWSWTHQGRSRATEVLGFLTWKQKTPKKSQQLKRKDTDMTDLKYDVTSITNVPTNVEHNAPSAASYRFCSWCAVANKKFGRTGNDATSCHKLLFFMYIMVKVKKHRAAMVDNGGTKFQQRMAYLWQLVRLGQRNASLEINYEEVQDALTPVGNM